MLKVARAVRPEATDGTEQVVFYLVGIGGESRGIDKLTDGAFGNGTERNVRSLYSFLVFNYRPGDQICLFGFSRGAFTVRTLAGFMNVVGLLEKEDFKANTVLPLAFAVRFRTKGKGWWFPNPLRNSHRALRSKLRF